MIQSLKNKDAQVLKAIHLKYKKRLVFFANKILNNNDEWADSFAGEALMKLWNICDFNSEAEIKDFLYRTVRNSCVAYNSRNNEIRFTDQEIQEFFMTAEILSEIGK
jgi:DNA-directed RNA polymerase specialized sigma24 family protein